MSRILVKLEDIVKVNPSSWSKKEGWSYLRYLDTSNITKGRIDEIVTFNTKSDKIPSRAKRIVQNGDFIYSTVRPNKKHYGLLKNIHDNLVVSTGFVVLRSKDPEQFDTRYIYLLVTQEFLTNYLHGIAENNTSTYPALRPQDLTNLEFDFPTISEQKSVADFIENLDDKIELNLKINQTLEDIAKTIFKSWFVDFDPVHAKAEGRPTSLLPEVSDLFSEDLVDSEIGKIPKGWKLGVIADVADQQKLGISPKNYPEEVFLYFSIPAFDEKQSPLEERGNSIKSNKTIVPTNSVLFSKLNPNTPRVWIPTLAREKRQICSTEFLVYLPKNGASQSYLWSIFCEKGLQKRIEAMVTGTSKSHQRVKPNDILNLKIPIPPKSLIKHFEKICSPIIQRILISKQEIQFLSYLRNALLPKFISGELQIPDTAEFLEKAGI